MNRRCSLSRELIQRVRREGTFFFLRKSSNPSGFGQGKKYHKKNGIYEMEIETFSYFAKQGLRASEIEYGRMKVSEKRGKVIIYYRTKNIEGLFMAIIYVYIYYI